MIELVRMPLEIVSRWLMGLDSGKGVVTSVVMTSRILRLIIMLKHALGELVRDGDCEIRRVLLSIALSCPPFHSPPRCRSERLGV